MAKAHVMVLPFPAQGHVTPFMELSHRLVDHGFEVTFVNTEVDHALVLAALPEALRGIHLESIPDGLADDENRKDLNKLVDAYSHHMPGYLEKLVGDMEAAGRPRVNWLVGDVGMGWSFEVAKKLGIRVASFSTGSVASLAIMLKIPKLIEDGVLNDKGWPERKEMLQLVPGTPPLHTSLLAWNNAGPPEGQHILFQLVCRNNKFHDLAEIVVCNSFLEAEASAFELFPSILPIGPLFADSEFRKPVGNFLSEDTRCLKWLDARPDGSVVYAAFGSMAIFDPRQFQELAEGLELTGRPFLWVVRPDFTAGLSKEWLDDFRQRVAGAGMIVSWCSQQQVLAHRAVACFVSHCGWNSTLEASRNGVPVLCWPYFCDQFLDRSYITDVWRTGLAVSPGEDGVVAKEEVRSKVEKIITDPGFRKRAGWLKDAASECVGDGGSSYNNFTRFVDLLSE
ncbi:UDP-glycosyltransferase 83A1-like [Lolium rigidum]|uniref:UDP-glycosyltransferase 83A1-like n=1 Tax=Lolium rigidum TaxID=89674 RepID=UPI001F5D2301|nr:UDP-glycosyltransferase 83A1-like [Lolium rigidum]